MGPIATAILKGCLEALKWLLWSVSALLLVLVIVQYFRGDAAANPAVNLITMAAFAVAGYIAHFAGRKISSN